MNYLAGTALMRSVRVYMSEWVCVRILPLLKSCRAVIADATLCHPGFAISSCEPMGWVIFNLACPYRREDGAISLSMSKRMKVKVCKLSSAKKVRKMRTRVRNRNMEMERNKEMGRQVLASTPMLGTARFETAPPHYLMQSIIIITIHQTHQYKSWIGRDPKALGALESWWKYGANDVVCNMGWKNKE